MDKRLPDLLAVFCHGDKRQALLTYSYKIYINIIINAYFYIVYLL